MRFGRLGQLKHGYNAMTTRESDMLMDIGYQEMDAENEIVEFGRSPRETAFVITTGDAGDSLNGKKRAHASRVAARREPALPAFRRTASRSSSRP